MSTHTYKFIIASIACSIIFFLSNNINAMTRNAHVLFSDNFESYNYGEIPSKWDLIYEGTAVETVYDPQNSNNKVLRMKGSLDWPARLERPVGTPDGDRIISCDVYLTNNMNLVETKISRIFFNGAGVQFHNAEDGFIKIVVIGGSEEGSIEEKSWHHLVMYVDWDNALYQIKIDNIILYQGGFTKNNENLWLGTLDNRSSRLMYVDNVIVSHDNVNLYVPTTDECATLWQNGDISIPCLQFKTDYDYMLYWLELEFLGQDKRGDLIWRLRTAGEN